LWPGRPAKRSKQKQRPARQWRTAQVDLHYQALELHPPASHRGQPPLKLWVVHVHETAAPADGSPPLRWTLLTTLPITLMQSHNLVPSRMQFPVAGQLPRDGGTAQGACR
jgi:hypothetical protein